MKDSLDHLIKIGFKEAKALTKKHAKTFYFASLLLPRKKRYASYAVYAICRLSDDAVDKTTLKKKEAIEKISDKIRNAYEGNHSNDPVILTFKKVIEDFKIPNRYFDELISGMFMDLEKTRYANFDELNLYCYRVAGVIGLIMLKIFGNKNRATEKHAIDMGIAMQLTNILRDIKEDYNLGRIYLPQDEIKNFGISESDIAQERVNENFIKLFKFQIKRARNYYESGKAGIKFIDNRASRLTAEFMREGYSKILDKIEENSYDVFNKRAHTSLWEKFKIALPLMVKE